MSIRLCCLVLLAASGCAHTVTGPPLAELSTEMERVVTRVGTFVVRAPAEGVPAGASPAEQLKVVIAGGEVPTVFYAGID